MTLSLSRFSPLMKDLAAAGIILFLTIVAALLVRRTLTKLADRVDKSNRDLIDDVIRATRGPVVMLILLGGTYLALSQLHMLGLDLIITKNKQIFAAGTTLIMVVGITQALNLAIMWYTRRVTEAGSGTPSQVGILRQIVMLIVWVLGILQAMAQVGLNVTTLLASLGIAGLAVGLALQDTIANIFAGFYLVIDRSVRVGDYVKLDANTEGFVEAVGWRNTRIKLWANNTVLIPNSKLIQSTITNMTLPDTTLSVYTYCGVSYDSDLEHVEAVAIDVANEVLAKFPGSDLSYKPVVRFKEFAESKIHFNVVFRAAEVGSQYLLKHEFMKALHKRFRQEGIEICPPVRGLVFEGHSNGASTESR